MRITLKTNKKTSDLGSSRQASDQPYSRYAELALFPPALSLSAHSQMATMAVLWVPLSLLLQTP